MKKISTLLFLTALVCVKGWGQVNGYSFSATSGTYTALSGATTVSPVGTETFYASSGDEGAYNSLPIGFTFNYGGSSYTTVSASTDGFAVLGSTLSTGTNFFSSGGDYSSNNLTGGTGVASSGYLAPLWDDLDMSGGTFSYVRSGSAGSYIFTMQWANVIWPYTHNITINFQIKLYQATGAVQYIYNQVNNTLTGSPSASIGIEYNNAASNVTLLSLNNSGTSPTAGTTETTTISSKPANGEIYTFAPVPPTITNFTPTSACASSNATVTITGTNLSGTTGVTIGGTTATISSNTATQIVATVGSGTTGNIVITTPAGMVTSTSAFTVNPTTSITTNPTATQTLCQSGTPSNLTVVAAGAGTLTYQWYSNTSNSTTGGTGAGSANGGQTATYTPSTAAAGTLYYYAIVTGTCGTATSATAQVIVNAAPSITSISASPTAVCAGGISTLTATPAATIATASLGTGTAVTASQSSGSALGPDPFETWYGGAKQQTLILASELTALGMQPGSVISALQLQMASVDGTVLNNVNVFMQRTTLTAAPATFVTTGFTTVYTASTYTPVAGYNNLPFTTNFTWDGTSNILIEMNYTDDITGNGTNTAYYTTTSFVSTSFYRADSKTAAQIAATTASAYTYSARNNFKFTFTTNPPVTWTPITGLYTNAAATTAYTAGANLSTVYSKPGATTTYTATATNAAGCTNSTASTVTVTLNATTSITTNPASTQTLCQNGTPTNLTVVAAGASLSYQWYSNTSNSTTGGTSISGATAATYTPSTATVGTKYYYVTVTGTCGTATSTTATVNVNSLPTATITSANNGSSCAGTSILVTISGTAGSSVTYTTNGSNAQTVSLGSGGNTTFNSSSSTGTYTYTLTDVHNATCTGTTGAASQTTTVTVYAYPTAAIAISPGTGYVQIGNQIQLTAGTSGGAWTSGTPSVASIGSSNGTVTGVTSGTSNVSYSVTQNGCSSNSNQLITVTADFVTKQGGNSSVTGTWQHYTTSGPVNDNTKPSSANTVEVQHDLLLDADFGVGMNKSFTITGSGTMTILPNVTFSSLGSVNFNNNSVTVKSDATGTGAIGTMATLIANATKVTAERYIGSAAYSTGRRAWRLVTVPVTGVSINSAWQEAAVSSANTPANPNPGYGTLITGNQQGNSTTAAGNGYDFWPAIANTSSSLRYYIATTGAWATYSSIKNVDINAQPAYMLFVRGSRTSWNTAASSYASTVGITTLRATGTLKQGAQTTTIPKGGITSYALAGNPYASAIDFEKIYTNSSTTGISPRFLVWNSQNGAYGAYTLVQRTGTNAYTVTPTAFGSTPASAQYIVSGQGFFVQPSSATTDGTLVIADNAKVSASTATINPYRLTPDTDKKLYVNLNLPTSDSTSLLADGIMERYDASYSAGIDGDDALKQANFNENLGIESKATDLIVEARPDVQKTDTVQLKLWNVSARSYQLQVKGDNFAAAAAHGLHAYVEDSYLQTRQEVSLTGSISTIPFTVTSNAASYDLHRFRIVFQSEATVLPLTLTQVKAAEQNSGVAVSWTVQNEENIKQYGVERSTDGGTSFTAIASQAAKNAAGVSVAGYTSFDAAPHQGDNLYRIRVEAKDGKVSYSNVVKVTVNDNGELKTLITLYPNPVSRTEGKTNLMLRDVKEGSYFLSVYSQSGQKVAEKKITVGVGTRTQTESLPIISSLAQGTYEVRLTDHNGTVLYKDHLLIGK